jgi:hypothetical protein
MPERRIAPDGARPKPAARPKDHSKGSAKENAKDTAATDRYVPPDIAGVSEQGFRARTGSGRPSGSK